MSEYPQTMPAAGPATNPPAIPYNVSGDVTQQQPVTQQPGSQPQPAYAKYTEKTGTQEWQNDLFDCFNAPDNLCLKATFCPCFVYGKTQHRTRDPTLAGYERINNDCLIFAGASAVCGLSWILQFIKRQEMREKYSIRGSSVEDCLYGYFCHCCSLIQIEKEICSRTGTSYTPVAGAQPQGYVAPAGMSATPANGGQ